MQAQWPDLTRAMARIDEAANERRRAEQAQAREQIRAQRLEEARHKPKERDLER